MRTIVVRITAPRKRGGGFPVELLVSETVEAPPTLRAREVIPRALEASAEILDSRGQVVSAARVQAIYTNHAAHASDLVAAGDFLHRLVFRGKVLKEWSASRKSASTSRGGPTRLMLDLGDDPQLEDLRALPWELLRDPATATYLALANPNPMVRGNAERNATPQVDWPLRVLVVFGAEPEDDAVNGDGIGANAELLALETLFAQSRREVEYELLMHPRPAAIVAACRDVEPHILHFIGHGESGATVADRRLRIFHPEDDAPPEYRDWPLLDIKANLSGFAPRFAFLNACRTADEARNGGEPLAVSSIADAFLQLGSLGVLAMQGDIPGDLAAAFSTTFYEKLIEGDPVDVAVLFARRDISMRRGNIATQPEWSFPVLRTRAAPEVVIPRRPAIVPGRIRVERFVARVPQRRKVRESLLKCPAPRADGSASPHLVLVSGATRVGKSHLAAWCAQLCEAMGLRAECVSFSENLVIDAIDALRCIRDGQLSPAGATTARARDWDLAEAAFNDFTRRLVARAHGVMDVYNLPTDAPVQDDNIRWVDFKNPDLESTLGDFRRALATAAEPKGLILVLDQIERLETTARTRIAARGAVRTYRARRGRGRARHRRGAERSAR